MAMRPVTPEVPSEQLAELKVPARQEFIGLAKRVGASLGGMVGFSLEEIDELSIAVAQACGSLIEAAEEMWGSAATLKLTYSSTQGGIAVDVETISPRSQEALPAPAPRRAAQRSPEMQVQQALQREMIRLFVDDFRHQVDSGRRQMRYRMVKYLIS
jgi:anti-sigma regulatory factor (Ser/Thr protein kinase)